MEALEIIGIGLVFSVVPLGIWALFRFLGKGVDFGIFAIVGGLLLLALISALHFGLGFFVSKSCAVGVFYTLIGDAGCSPIIVACCYALIIYGLINVVYYFSRRNS